MKHLFTKKTKDVSILLTPIVHSTRKYNLTEKKHKGYLFAEISFKAAAYLRCKNKNKRFQGKWETRDQF